MVILTTVTNISNDGNDVALYKILNDMSLEYVSLFCKSSDHSSLPDNILMQQKWNQPRLELIPVRTMGEIYGIPYQSMWKSKRKP